MSRLDLKQAELKLKSLDKEWTLVDGNQLERVFEFEDFNKALAFVNKIAKIADKLNHHPEIELSYGEVEVELTTHSENGLTSKDFEYAAEIDRLV